MSSSPTLCKIRVSLVLLFFISPSFSIATSSASNDDLRLSPSTYTPKLQAERLIRSLKLFPNKSVNVRVGEPGFVPGKIVEKKFSFFGANYGPSVEDLGHHAGYYSLPHSRAARMFYLFFESRSSRDDPVVLWLTGGPGCGSELALFYENGPFKFGSNLSLVWNDYGWDVASNIVFVDQPTGTGFSYTSDASDLRHDEEGVSTDLYDFMQAFFMEHPQLVRNDFYITGESYAGHYIPALASRIHQSNKRNQGIHINLKGFAIGNGLTDPEIQYPAYIDFALDRGLINQFEYAGISLLIPACEVGIKTCAIQGGNSCMASLILCEGILRKILFFAGNVNYYDIRKQCVGKMCYDYSNVETFLNMQSVRDAIGVGRLEFVSCSRTVYEAMLQDWLRNMEVGIPALLEDGIKMLVYAGEEDLICNWLGNSRWVHAMQWSGQQQFGASPNVQFLVDGTQAGLLKTYGPLTFLKLYGAGHMVPMDQPKAALQMLIRWMQGNLR